MSRLTVSVIIFAHCEQTVCVRPQPSINATITEATKLKFSEYTKASFGLRNRPLEWNDYSYGRVILLFGKVLFPG